MSEPATTDNQTVSEPAIARSATWCCHNCGYSGNRSLHCDGCDLTKSEGEARD